MKSIEFKDKSAKKIYDSYIRRINRTINVLSKNDKEDILMEFNSHIYEGLKRSEKPNEITALLQITHELGDPEDVLKSLVAEKKLNEATTTFNPKHILQAIFLNIKRSGIFIVFSLLYLSLFAFIVLIISEILAPEETGLFFKNEKFMVLGRLSTSENVNEVLGIWFIPLMVGSILLLYLMITLLMKLTRKK